MPLPLPNLDTRRWLDLVDEGRALIPRYAPAWTDHNAHDPGITLMELLAWFVEQDVYRANRIPDHHRRKFLALAGFVPQPPQPARTVLTFRLNPAASPHLIPTGLTIATISGSAEYPFRTLAPLTILPIQISALQVFDGQRFVDQTRTWHDGLSFPLFGENPVVASSDPDQQPAFYIGLNQAILSGQRATFWLWFDGLRTDAAERQRIAELATWLETACQPIQPHRTCPPPESPQDPWCQTNGEANESQAGNSGSQSSEMRSTISVDEHHTVRTAWDFFDGTTWQPLDPGGNAVDDQTRGLTLDGPVHITPTVAMEQGAIGAVAVDQFYLRCRLVAGPPDTAPRLRQIAPNSVSAEQATAAYSTFTIAPGVMPPIGQSPERGVRQKLALELDEGDQIIALAAGPEVDGPECLVLNYLPAQPALPGSLTASLMLVGRGDRLPDQIVELPEPLVSNGQAQVWTQSNEGLEPWSLQPDLDASSRTDAHFQLAPTTGIITFGDGEHGRVLPKNAPILAAYDQTTGTVGNVAAGSDWTFRQADDLLNDALLSQAGSDLLTLQAALDQIANLVPATGGAEADSLNHTAGRAAESLWVHERLVELCPTGRCATLDQLDRAIVLARKAPQRAVTLLDFERIALEVPGTHIARARAWAGIDPTYPCLKAPGTVTVVIVPALPSGRPEPSPALLEVTRRYLDRQRVIGTRLVVLGPTYLTVTVQARVRAKSQTNLIRVLNEIISGLDTFLDPLRGGPNGRGWPFGRDVYRAEILQVIDNVSGVDHVLELELAADNGEAQCANLCVGPTWLVTPGLHQIEVV